MDKQKYTSIGIYEKGDVITVRNTREAFLDCTFDFALIREIKGEPIGEMSFGLVVYDRGSVDCDICNIAEVDTWKKIVESGLIDSEPWDSFDEDENPLRWLLESEFRINTEVFDYLLEKYPNTRLEDMLWKIKRYNAAVWAHEHGANPYYDGLTYDMKEVMKCNRYIDSEKIYEYLYENNTEAVEH